MFCVVGLFVLPEGPGWLSNKKPSDVIGGPLLPDLDSNQDKQNQNLRYYRYTIGQFRFCFEKADCKNKIIRECFKIKGAPKTETKISDCKKA